MTKTTTTKRASRAINNSRVRRVNTKKQDGKSEPMLNADIFSLILPMLPPRDMLNLACSSKWMLQLLNRSDILRSAVMQGGFIQVSMMNLIKLLRSPCKIHLPSCLRMLRIACGQTRKQCENPGCFRLARKIDVNFGLFFCSSCLSKKRLFDPSIGLWTGELVSIGSKGLASLWNANFSAIVINDHVAKKWNKSMSKFLILGKPVIINGEHCGPLVTFEEAASAMNNINKTIHHILPLLPSKEMIALLSLTLEEATLEYNKIEVEQWFQRIDRRQMKLDAKYERNKKIVDEVANMVHNRWKSAVQQCTWEAYENDNETDSYDSNYASTQGTVRIRLETPRFLYRIVAEHMNPAVEGTTPVTKRQLKEIVENINRDLDEVENSGFATLSFLSNNASSEPFQSDLRAHLSLILPRALIFTHYHLDGDCIKFIRYGKYFEALLWMIWQECGEVNYSRIGSTLAGAMMKATEASTILATQNQRNLFVALWDDSYDADLMPPKLCRSSGFWSVERCEAHYLKVKEEFECLSKVLKQYENKKVVKTFISREDQETAGENRMWIAIKMNSLNALWSDRSIIKHLRTGNFDSLFVHHHSIATGRWDRRHNDNR